MSMLATSGARSIGPYSPFTLSEVGYNFVVYDNLLNSLKESIKRVGEIINKSISFEDWDIRDKELLKKVFEKYDIDSVVYFFGLEVFKKSTIKKIPHKC